MKNEKNRYKINIMKNNKTKSNSKNIQNKNKFTIPKKAQNQQKIIGAFLVIKNVK